MMKTRMIKTTTILMLTALTLTASPCLSQTVADLSVNADTAQQASSSADLLKMLLASIGCIALIGITVWLTAHHFAKKERTDRLAIWDWIEDHLFHFFCLTWCSGFITYFVGSYVGSPDTDWGWSVLSALPMAVIHSTEMFIGMSDISAIHDDRFKSILFMSLFNASHFCAIAISLCFVIKHFGYHAISHYRLWLEVRARRQYSDIYIFWGTNDESVCLAKSTIEYKKSKGQNDYICLFVKTPFEENENESHLGFGRYLNFVSLKDKELRKLNDIEDSYIMDSHHKLSLLDTSKETGKTDILRKHMRLKQLTKLLNQVSPSSDCRIHFFFISDNRDANINATINILKDSSLEGKNLEIYCQARLNAKTRWMEHYYTLHNNSGKDKDRKGKVSIHVIDTALMSVQKLKTDLNNHPVQTVDIDKATGVATDTYNSLVIGFNETGVEAMRFAYEFGTFVNTEGQRLPGTYTAIDRNMDELKGSFLIKAPALEGNSELKLVKCSVGTEDYWKTVMEQLPHLKQIFICLGDDNLGINTAVDICSMARRCRYDKKPERLTVYLRSYNNDNINRIRQVADDINRSCKDMNINIEVFGDVEQTFTFDNIINDRVLIEAKAYNYAYAGSNGDLEEVWRSKLGLNSDSFTMTDIEEIERKRDQNISNALHRLTKTFILKQCGSLENPPLHIKQLLAKMEHERWVAASKLNGWRRMAADEAQQTGKTKDIRQKLHADICEWKDVRAWSEKDRKATLKYDMDVVDTSIQLELEDGGNLA